MSNEVEDRVTHLIVVLSATNPREERSVSVIVLIQPVQYEHRQHQFTLN